MNNKIEEMEQGKLKVQQTLEAKTYVQHVSKQKTNLKNGLRKVTLKFKKSSTKVLNGWRKVQDRVGKGQRQVREKSVKVERND